MIGYYLIDNKRHRSKPAGGHNNRDTRKNMAGRQMVHNMLHEMQGTSNSHGKQNDGVNAIHDSILHKNQISSADTGTW